MAKTTWVIDPAHSEISFKIKHMMFTNMTGRFHTFEATIENEADNMETSKISFSADVASISTHNEDRDNHLRSADFFDVEKFPKISFASTSLKRIKESNYQISGDLTIKGATKNITLDADYSGFMKDPWGNTKIGLYATSKINRKDFGLTWNTALESGGILVGDEVTLVAELQFVQKQ